ncbi:AAA family ATPase [Enterococcus sp. AZ109]|uniref:AAA family ATPase n=1 Tax=Enterococcus sp. AZ109 TaxID=2774634 RepID=UPI003F2924D7
MLPKKIIMENFGPFVHEEVDFSYFFDTPLFLISGKTGAGKTTIFDAITFALFGDASGGVRNASEIRSTFANPTEETKVTFYFEHQGRQFIIERSPKQIIEKKNGKGNTTKNQKVQLIVLNDEGKELEAYQKIEPVNDMIYSMLHLNKDQFRQIAMLPQGEFRTFLVANSSEKEIVLRSLFATAVYRTFTEELKAKKQTLEKDVSEIMVRIDQLFQQVTTEKGDTYQESLNTAKDYLTTEKKLVQEMQKELSTKTINYKKQQGKLAEAEQILIKFQQFDEVQKEVQLFQQQEPDIQKKRTVVNMKKKVQQVLPIYTNLQELGKRVQELRQQIADTEEALKILEEKQKKFHQHEEIFKSEEALWETKEQQLQEWKTALPFVTQKEELEAQRQQQLHEQKIVQQEADRITVAVKNIEMQMAKLKKHQDVENFWQDRRYQEIQFNQQIEQLLQELRQLDQQEERVEEQQIQLAVLTDQISQISNKLTEQNAAFKKRKSQWTRLEIARLSQELLPGEPCPVCGSLDHPNPASGEGVSSEELMRLQIKMEETENLVKRLQVQKATAENELRINSNKYETARKEYDQQVVEFQKKIEVLIRRVEDYYNEQVDMPLEELKAYLTMKEEQTTQELATIIAAKQELIRLETKKSKLGGNYEKIAAQIRESHALFQLLCGRLQTVSEQAKSLEADSLKKNIDDLEFAISERQTQLEVHQKEQQLIHSEKVRLAESLKQLTNQENSLTIEQEQKSADFSEMLLEMKLTIKDITKKENTSKDLEELERAIKTFDEKQLLTLDRLKQLENQLADKAFPDLEPIRKQTDQLEASVREAQERFYQKDLELKQFEKLLQQIEELHFRGSHQLDELTELTELFQVMNGDNQSKISLERFVLQWYLNEVLQAANQQLALLTNSRYQFELNQQIGRSKGNTGLEINIYDDNTGASRSAHTLSGGESFIAALALALGLAEVIQNKSGGIAMETLFIDEGFGSLDEEALEMAVSALEGIESQGRMIGIISHVRELKERIPLQVIVQTSGTGQSTICYQIEG